MVVANVLVRSSQAAFRRLTSAMLVVMSAVACGSDAHSHEEAGSAESAEPEPWAVTAWGERYEIFPEIDPLVAGGAAESHTHVTVLADFSPLTEGEVAIVLRDASGAEQVFRAGRAKRPGIFPITITPTSSGEFELLFRVAAAQGREEIAGGRVRVGEAGDPGGLIEPSPPTAAAESAAAAQGGEEVPFLKEQQWKVPFSTSWTEEGELRTTLTAPGRLVARPGGDRALTAPADGVVGSSPFPHTGRRFGAGELIFSLTPRLDPERSVADVQGDLLSAEAELSLAEAEARRARELAESGVIAGAERDRAEAALAVANARVEAARRDATTMRRAREGAGGGAESLPVRAPFNGAVADVTVSAGQAVAAGDELARFVAGGPLWVEAWLAPQELRGLEPGPTRLSLATGEDAISPWTGLAARVAAIAPALDPDSGRRTVLLELESELPELGIGQSIEVELDRGEVVRGVIVPVTALVDDAGVPVVYVQLSGETMLRRTVEVVARSGNRRLVRGLEPGERIVTVGGTAVRRSSLVSSGVGEGHVH